MAAAAPASLLTSDSERFFTPAATADPSTADGSVVVFSRELPLEVRHSDDLDSTLGTLLSIQVKVVVLYNEHSGQAEAVRVELARESDLFFAMYSSLQERGFAAMQARQKLMVPFQEYPHMLVANFTKCLKDPHNCMAVLYIHRDGNGRLDFIQNMEFKFVELLSVDFLLTPSEVIKQHILYRYFAMKSQVEVLQARLQDVNELVKAKSPSLLLAIKKTPLRGGAGSAAAASSSFATSASSTGAQRPAPSPTHSASSSASARKAVRM